MSDNIIRGKFNRSVEIDAMQAIRDHAARDSDELKAASATITALMKKLHNDLFDACDPRFENIRRLEAETAACDARIKRKRRNFFTGIVIGTATIIVAAVVVANK